MKKAEDFLFCGFTLARYRVLGFIFSNFSRIMVPIPLILIDFKIKILDITLYRYSAESQEKYVNGKFESFSATTNQNEKKKFSKIYKKGNKFFIEGSSYKGEAPEDFIIGSWWNHSIIKYGVQISTGSGRIIKQNVSFVGKETIEINNKKYSTLKFNFFSEF